MTVLLRNDHDKIVKNLKRRHRIIHLLGVLVTVGILAAGWIYNLDRRIILASYQTIKMERDSILLKHELLQVLRKRPLTLSNALDILEAVSNQRAIPIPIILGIIEQESQFDPKAVSPKGARGISQLMPIVWKHYGNGTSIHDFLSNITASIAYLTDLRGRFGDWSMVLRAYVAGPSRAGDKEIDWYSRAVLRKAARWERQMEE